jgi:hypothetical protein
MKRLKSRNKPYWEMSAAELAAATKEFDKPLPASRYRPLTKAARARFERALRAGSQIRRLDELGLDLRLLSEAAAYAKRKGMPLSKVLERGLRRELAVQE